MPTSSTNPFPPLGPVRPDPGTSPAGAPPFSHHVVLIAAQVYPTLLLRTPTPPRSRSVDGPPA